MAKSYVGNLSVFNHTEQEWEIFYSRLNQFMKLNSVAAESKSALLLTHLSDETYRLARNLVHPEKIEDVKFEALVLILNKHFTPKRCTFADRAKFYEAIRGVDESVEDWAARVRALAVHCDFGASLQLLLKDKFVLGLRVGPERDRLFEQDACTLTFAKAVEVAQQAECARRSRAVPGPAALVPVKEEPLFRADSQRAGPQASRQQPVNRCSVCGLKGHKAEKCRYKNYRCQKCNNKGHLKKVCEVRFNSLNAEQQAEDVVQESQDCSDCPECRMYSLRCVKYDPIVMTVDINGNLYDMELDSGSSTSVISDYMYKKHFPGIKLLQCDLKMCLYNGHKIAPIGCFSKQVTYNNMTRQITFYVIKNGGPPLLGRDFMAKFDIRLMSVNNHLKTCSNDTDVCNVLNKYTQLFNDELGCFKYSEVKLQLKQGVKPKFCKARPLPFALKGPVENELMRLVDNGILVPVNYSDYATPIVPVRKANGSVRICADYSLTINNDVYIDKYPLPRIEEVFAKLSGGQHFSKLDCSQAYNQFLLSKESQKLTTINTTKGLFMYTRLVFGLASAPAIFQREIENVLAGIDGVAVFLDDVCVTGPTKEIHLNRLSEVFKRFQDAGLRLGKDKCVFFQESVTYLGHIIDKMGLHKCSKKIEAITSAPRPKNVTELKRFLGMANYYRNFVPNASSLLGPLHELLRSEAQWEWGERQQVAFEAMKRELASERVLAHFDPDAPLTLAVDAGPAGLGAVLSTRGVDGVERPLAFGSRSLSAGERNYSQLHKEAAAIVFGIKRFHQYLYGRKDPFILKTDHKPLLAIFGKQNGIPVMTASRLIRFGIFLSAYNYRIQYTSSKDNQVADYFSRVPTPDKPVTDDDSDDFHSINSLQLNSLPLTYKDIQVATANDATLCMVFKYIRHGWPRKIMCKNILPFFQCRNELEIEKGCLLRGHRVVIPTIHRDQLLQELHKSHQGIVKTKHCARARLWWPGIDKQIEQLINACTVCVSQRSAPPRAAPAPWPRPIAAWERLHFDYMSIGQRTYLVVVDAYSKWLECLYMESGTSSRHLINKLKFLFARYGLPRILVSDNDVKIVSQEFIEFCKINGIEHITSPIYHPCSNGQAENSVKTCKKMLKSILQMYSCVNTITDKLQEYLFEYRNTVHCTTGASPAKLMLGRELRCRLDLLVPPRSSTDNDSSDEHYDKCRSFAIGDSVWTRCYENRKPYWAKGIITKVLGSRMYEVNTLKQNSNCKRHIDQLWKYRGEQAAEFPPYSPGPPLSPVGVEPDSPACVQVAGEEIRVGEEMTEQQPVDTLAQQPVAIESPSTDAATSPTLLSRVNLRPRIKEVNYKI